MLEWWFLLLIKLEGFSARDFQQGFCHATFLQHFYLFGWQYNKDPYHIYRIHNSGITQKTRIRFWNSFFPQFNVNWEIMLEHFPSLCHDITCKQIMSRICIQCFSFISMDIPAYLKRIAFSKYTIWFKYRRVQLGWQFWFLGTHNI